MNLSPKTLFGRTVITIATTLLVFMVISMSAAVYFIFIPMAQRSADDFAAVVVSAAHSLESLPEELQPQLQQQLLKDHGLIVTEQSSMLPAKSFDIPYYIFFQQSLARRAGTHLHLTESEMSPLIWIDVPAHGKTFRIGFDRKRVGTNPPVVLLLAITVGALLTLFASLFEVRRVVKPLQQLSRAAQELGRGHNPKPLPEEGPEEIAALARAFNRMSSDIHELSENRTIVIGGISHDLRTPLTRLGLAVEMLGNDTKPELVAAIRRDLAAMNKLIGQFMQFTRGIEEYKTEELDLWDLIESQAKDLEREGATLLLHRHNPPCKYYADAVALGRVVGNLMSNAAKYGNGLPIDVDLHCTERIVSIEISDRGPGIPDNELEAIFRPFHRLEKARSMTKGGSGMGLAIARQLANKNGWTINLVRREGGGTIAKLGLIPALRRCGHSTDDETSQPVT